jgi:hypothetical protein
MATPRLNRAEFDALVRRAGLKLGDAHANELYGAWGTLEALIDRLRKPLPAETEPATIFVVPPDAGP